MIEDESLEYPGAGALEIQHNGSWYAVCDASWDPEDGKVACTQLGFDLLGDIYTGLTVNRTSYISNVECPELYAGRLDECAYEVTSSNCSGAGVFCLNGKTQVWRLCLCDLLWGNREQKSSSTDFTS